MALVKAKLISSDGGGTIEFMFNPNQLAFQRQISLNKNIGARTEKGLPKVDFAYPNPCTLTINDILLDTYEESNAKSVMPYIAQFDKAVKFLESGTNKSKRPPTYVFTWGSNQYIRCFVSNLSYKLTMFLPDGTPVRAKLDLTLEEIDLSSSNPNLGASNNVNRTSDTRENRS